jgi:Domain of unknown function (DUF4337)
MGMAEETKPNEGWLRWVAVSTTVFAVAAAICTARSAGFTNKISLLTTQENDQWSYYQAKSVKEHLTRLQEDTFRLRQAGSATPAERKMIAVKLQEYDANVTRYGTEMTDIQKQAQQLGTDRDKAKGRSGVLSQAIIYLQLAIMMCSVTAMLKQKPLWLAGVAMGIIGVVLLFYGFF